MIKELTNSDYQLISDISTGASEKYDLNFERCYILTLLYYLVQYGKMLFNDVPAGYAPSVELLVRQAESSYIHYILNIYYCHDKYVKAIKRTEIELIGKDPCYNQW